MKVFLTGASGYLGSAVVHELTRAGHEVSGLARSTASADALRRLGGRPVEGNLRSPETWKPALSGADAVVHLAADHEGDTAALDRGVVDLVLAAGRTGDRPRSFVYTSGCWILGDTGDAPAAEDRPVNPAAISAWRAPHERLVLEGAREGFATAVIRPGMVYGGKRGLVAPLYGQAEAEGAVSIVGDGANRWSMVHRDDLAMLYRLLIEKPGRGVFHGVEDEPIVVGELARLISEAAGAGGAVRRIPLESARERMGPVADALALDQFLIAPASRELGWSPAHGTFAESVSSAYREFKS